jgi:hypothetical protein
MGGWEPFGPLRTITRAEGNILCLSVKKVQPTSSNLGD